MKPNNQLNTNHIEKLLSQSSSDPVLNQPLDDDMKMRIQNRTLEKIHSQTSNSEVTTSSNNTISEHVKRNKRHTFSRYQSIAAACLILFVISSITVGAVYFHLDEHFKNYFHKMAEKQDDNTMYVKEHKDICDNNGKYTATVDQMIGDHNSVYILFHIDHAKDLAKLDTHSTPPIFANYEVTTDIDNYEVSDPVFSGITGDNAYYIIAIRTASDMNGKKISLSLGDTGYYDSDINFHKLSAGGYELSWNSNYKISTKEYVINKKIDIYEGTATLQSISISPLSISINLSDIKSEKECSNPNDQIIVTMKDGTIYDSYHSDDIDIYNDYDVISMGFHSIINPEDIKSITLGGVPIDYTRHPQS